MNSSSSLSKRLVSALFLVIIITQIMFIYMASSLNLTNTYLHHKCLISQGIYSPGSVYEKNLNTLIDAISTINFRDGFMHTTEGKKPNSASLLFQCRGDSYWSKCGTCYKAAVSRLRKKCPRNKGGIIWFDQCFLEITTVSMFDAKDEIDYENIVPLRNPKMVNGDAKLFNNEIMAFLEKLTLKASDRNNLEDGRIALYTSGEETLGTKRIYAMVQCTRFVYMPMLCKVCLETIVKKYFPKCCDGRQGGRVLGTSCNFRYEFYPFLRKNKIV